MASTYTELMSLSVQDLYRVQLEFQEYYEDLFELMKQFLHRIMIVKLGTIHRCNNNEFAIEKDKLKIRSFVI